MVAMDYVVICIVMGLYGLLIYPGPLTRQYRRYLMNRKEKEKFNGITEADILGEESHKARVVDNVNNPRHYTVGGYESLDVLRAKLSPEEYRGFCKGNILKYIMRANYKGHHDQDCDKALFYAKELSNALESKRVQGPVSWTDAKSVREANSKAPPF